jgi:methyl-accepting chemotaxis protein
LAGLIIKKPPGLTIRDGRLTRPVEETVMRFRSARSTRQSTHRQIPSSLRPLVRDLEAIADGDLTIALDGGNTAAGKAIAAAATRLVDDLRGVLTDVSAGRESLATGWHEVNDVAWAMLETSETTASRAANAAATANEVSDSMHRIAAATEELAATIREVASHASLASSVANDVSAQVVAANGTVSQLETSSREIQKVVDLISSIASQTHLLALNATIEAARAGDAGLGFTVVAGEVKLLAAQTSTATTNVTRSVQSIQAGSHAAADVMGAVTDTISRVSDNQSAIAAAVEQQTATTHEIGRNTALAAQGSASLADNVEALVAAVRTTAYAGAQARTVAGELAALESTLERVLDRYTYIPVQRADAVELQARVATTADGVVTIQNDVFGTELYELSYGEHWRHSKVTIESDGTDSYCGIPDDAVTLRFRGKRVRFYGMVEANHGIGAISLDGGPEVLVDEYAPSRESRMLWESPQLADGEHTLTLRVTGQLNPASRYIWTTVDRFEVTL